MISCRHVCHSFRDSKQRVARWSRCSFSNFIYRSRGRESGGTGEGIAAFTSNKIPANLSTLQPQRQNSSVEIGDRGVGYRGGSTGEQGGGWTVERGGGPDGTGCSG